MKKQQMEIMQTGAGQKNNHFVTKYDSMFWFFFFQDSLCHVFEHLL